MTLEFHVDYSLHFFTFGMSRKIISGIAFSKDHKMSIKYSELKKKLKIEVKKPEQTELANLTHFLHSITEEQRGYYKNAALDYLESFVDGVEEPIYQTKIPLEWDIPFPAPQKPKFTFIDLFAGIGGFRLGFQEIGGKCVFTSEWNHYAQKTYEANFGEVPFGDITKINESDIPDHDILVGGFPCQPFSIAGVSKKNSLGRTHGFLDETQGTLFFDIVRIIQKKRPKAFLLENVKNLVSHDMGNTFRVISNAIDELRYTFYPMVLDGKYFVPQHRERIIMVGFDRDHFKGKEEFIFPKMPQFPPMVVEDILEKVVDEKYTLSDKLWDYLQRYAAKHKAAGNGFGFGLVNFDGISRTLSARYYKDGSEILIPQEGKNPRRLTPRECARLQGYPENFIIPVSDTQAYKQFGNSVVMPLMKEVGISIFKTLKFEEKKHVKSSV
ncbi:DNA (cytosine-5)-methyltransferase 1 [Algoriphagus antarcticus]|uniref:Cytosine-specific methyltransferase n=2 Tax=Algoriphagus antarcticus TaxID=238540 RepID=A0A3E0E7T8_9BACT|nr:DNA (cytosine-5)-methyltransferase 1 [Algoriphagus antarcticus]